jgi:hypothetical protein
MPVFVVVLAAGPHVGGIWLETLMTIATNRDLLEWRTGTTRPTIVIPLYRGGPDRRLGSVSHARFGAALWMMQRKSFPFPCRLLLCCCPVLHTL